MTYETEVNEQFEYEIDRIALRVVELLIEKGLVGPTTINNFYPEQPQQVWPQRPPYQPYYLPNVWS